MHVSPFHYLPLTLGFFSIFICALIVLFIGFVVLDLLRHAYLNLGVSPRTAMYLLIGSLIGSYFNIPVAVLPGEPVVSNQVITFFGMQYTVPVAEHSSGTVIAINVGGAVIPTLMSIYLLITRNLWVKDRSRLRWSPLRYIGSPIPCPASASRYRYFSRR